MKLLADPSTAGTADLPDLSGPQSLAAIFNRERVSYTAAKWRRERRGDVLVAHPLAKQVLAEYGDEIAELLSCVVPAAAWAPSPAYHVMTEKDGGGQRDLVFPGLIDVLVGRRVIDELEPHIRHGDDDRVFSGRTHPTSRSEPGDYADWRGEWKRYLDAEARAASEAGFAYVLTTDILEFFPTIDRATARETIARRTRADTAVIELLFACMEAWLPRFNYRRAPGLPVEPHDLSRLVAHCLLKSVDAVFEDGYDLRYRRFVDDTVIFVDTREAAESVRERHREALSAYGLRPNQVKTEILETSHFRAQRREQQFQRIDALARAGAQDELRALADRSHEGFESKDRGERLGWIRVAKRLYTTFQRMDSDAMVDRAIEDVAHEALTDSALRYLRSRQLGIDEVAGLCARYDSASQPGLRIELARTLADVALRPGVDAMALASWASANVRRESGRRGDGYARGLLLLLVFKHGGRAEREAILSWASPLRLTDPWLRALFFYVFTATREVPEKLGSVLRLGGSQDLALLARLCDDARNRRIRRLGRVLATCRVEDSARHWVISAERLPFLRIVADAATEPEASEWRSQTRAWLERALEPGHAPRDRAVRDRLESHLETIKS